MTRHLIAALLWCVTATLPAQHIPDFAEPADPHPGSTAAEWHRQVKKEVAGWGSTDTHYARHTVPAGLTSTLRLKAWRGERINAQAVFATGEAHPALALRATSLRKGSDVVPSGNVQLSFVRYVLTDSLKDDQGGCGYRLNKAEWDSLLVADMLDPRPSLKVEAQSVRPVWLSILIPQDAAPGRYKGAIYVGSHRLSYEVDVLDRTLTPPAESRFHLDLWQNPYAVARFYGVPLWSDEHFAHMEPIMRRLAEAGQKVITTTLMRRPWNGQTEDAFESMVLRVRRTDGTWAYDYTVFDRWVEWMMEMGVSRQINCYTLVPWNLQFDYIDQATGAEKHIKAEPGTEAYEQYWLPFLRDFAAHLRQKGWFDRTYIALDERPMHHMRAAISLLHRADPQFRISGAAHYYPEVEPQMDDLCLGYADALPDSVHERRRAEGKMTTMYTCCTEARPNTFLVSAPAEATWLPIHAEAMGFDGYLRWAYNSWTADPQRDARFRTWVGGDCYLVYPGASSIRLERLQEGVQCAEKIRVLREEYRATGQTAKLRRLEQALEAFTPRLLGSDEATASVRALLPLLNP